jgi:hypothetical protein
MALPLPRVIADVGPGGGLVTSLGGMNALANQNILRQINQIKKQYMPLTTQADIASKNAYAALVGLQPLGKILGNKYAYSNIPDEQKNEINNRFLRAGGVGPLPFPNTNSNALNQMPQMNAGSGNEPDSTFSGYVQNALKNIFSAFANKSNQVPQQNQLNPINPYAQQATSNQPSAQAQQETGNDVVSDNGNEEAYRAYDAWMKSPEGIAELKKGEDAEIPTEEQVKQWNRLREAKAQSSSTNEVQPYKTNAEKTGAFEGTIKEGEKLGEHRAKAINDIGEQQLALSASGNNLDKLIEDFTNPKFISLREKFPLLQDTQLEIAKATGNSQQQEMIGKIIADLEAFQGATVMGFKGQTLKREFDYANKLKPSTKDTVYTALGKLQSLKALKEIAYQKNKLIKRLIKDKHMDLADAVDEADKKIDIKAIEEKVEDLTSPTITIKNKKTGNYMSFTKARAEELGIPYE